MISLSDSRSSRRSFLRIGSLGLGGLALPQMLSAAQVRPVKDKAVIFVFMHGGPPQTELFDPKMDAPSEIRSAVGEIPTTIPGVTFGSTMEHLAKIAHRCAIVRSFSTESGDHDIKPIMSKESLEANLGSLYARVAGATRPDSGMPTNAALFPRAVEDRAQERNDKFGKFLSTGPVGQGFAPFAPGSGGNLQDDMKLHISRARLDDRRYLLRELDSLKRHADSSGEIDGLDRFQQQAFSVILGGISNAFDISKEDPRTLDRYDTSKLLTPDQISKRWNNHQNYVDHVRSLGKLLLMSRRLVEAGCGFVTVTTNFVWDFHADKNNATLDEGMRYVAAPFDRALSALIEDLHRRGLSEKVLVVCCGEMGRTPKINKNGGRDHWGKLAPLLLSGGGLNMAQVIGSSTKDAGEPASDPVSISDLQATIFNTLMDPGQVRLMSDIPDNVKNLITGGRTIRGLH